MNHLSRETSDSNPYFVAIGASAGGLEAIHEFFDNMPSNGNFSFVIIQHLSPDYKSLLVELIAKHTRMKVYEAGHDAAVESNCIYVIPNNKLLTIQNGLLQLSQKSTDKSPNTAIDTFLHSLAADKGKRAVAVILSGTGTDGSKGIQSIKQQGGFVLVQDPVTAKFDGMPNAAIATGDVDYILAPELMPEEIFNHIKERPVRIAAEGHPTEEALPEVLRLIEQSCHHDFVNYKTPTILRRITRRMGLLNFGNFNQYLEHLRNTPEECRMLGKEFLIGVTRFFRDTPAFQVLREQVIPELVRSRQDGGSLKIWVTACSTGEEAYSIAMLVDDVIQSSGKLLEVKIFATDIDPEAIEAASRGVYPETSLQEMSETYQRRYFIKEGVGQAIIHPRIRKQIVFARHNVLKDPPFIKNDLVTCRNMLIYMNQLLQQKVLSTLKFSLNTGGYLFLGPSEIPASIKDGISEVNNKWKIYRKLTGEFVFSPERYAGSQQMQRRDIRVPVVQKEVNVAKELSDDFRNLLAFEYGFAAVYIDKNFEIKEAVGDFRKYLNLPDKIASLNILKMVESELSVALNTAIRRVMKEQQKVVVSHIRLRDDAPEKYINLFVKPATREGYLMIAFGESNPLPSSRPFVVDGTTNPESATYISELEEDLKETRANLQMAIEGLETANEELQSSNEELLSANEELQSSNEELQSLNEELHTLNTEHQLRIRELIELNDDLSNYFRSSGIAQVFVDKELRIRKFNPLAVSMINLIETDIGRPIEHISTNLKDNKDFVRIIRKVIQTGKGFEKEVTLANGRIQLMKVLPYVKLDQQVDGTVITFTDITGIKELDSIVKAVFNATPGAICAFKAKQQENGEVEDLVWIAANHAADKMLGMERSEYIGKSLRATFPAMNNQELFQSCIQILEKKVQLLTEVQLTTHEGVNWYEVSGSPMEGGLVLNLFNIEEKKQAQDKFRKNYYELMKVKENYRNLNIELEEKVNERTHELSQSEERFRLIANATSDAIWDWDLVNNQIWWSENFYKAFGFDKDAVNHSVQFWMSRIHEEDRERVSGSIHQAINRGDQEWNERYRLQRSDGSYAPILDRGRVLTDEQGIPYRMVGAMMDMTELETANGQLQLKNSELQTVLQEFKFVTDFMPQLVWATLPDGYHDFYNKGWFDYTGLSFEETKGKGWSLVVHPDDQEKAWEVWHHSLQTGDPYEIEYRFRRYDGEYRWFLGRALPLRNEAGEIVKWFGTGTDIHDQKTENDILERKVDERTTELKRINDELEVSNNELLQFASVASHDLKEPLRKIHMFGHMLKDRCLSDGGDELASNYVNRIIGATGRMTQLINDLLSFTRLSVPATFEEQSLEQILHEVMSDLELLIKEKEAQFSIDPLPDAEVVKSHIRQVFQNIISNAMKFSRPGINPHIRIRCERVATLAFVGGNDPSGPYCRISIQDNGIGFDNAYAEKIFTIFQRLHSKEQYDGTGIGLAITRKIIEKHGGIITAYSEAGEGATFSLVIPLEQRKEEQKEDKRIVDNIAQ